MKLKLLSVANNFEHKSSFNTDYSIGSLGLVRVSRVFLLYTLLFSSPRDIKRLDTLDIGLNFNPKLRINHNLSFERGFRET